MLHALAPPDVLRDCIYKEPNVIPQPKALMCEMTEEGRKDQRAIKVITAKKLPKPNNPSEECFDGQADLGHLVWPP